MMKPMIFSGRLAVGDLVDLERQQDRRREEREVLGPALHVPQADRLDSLEHAEGEQPDPDLAQRPRAQREQLVELVQDPDVAAGLDRAAGDAALQVGEDPVVGVAQAVLVTGERDHRDPEQHEDHEVKRAVDRDQAQHDLVAQRLAAQRHRDLVAFRRMLARRLRRRRAAAASCRSAGSGTSERRRSARANSAILRVAARPRRCRRARGRRSRTRSAPSRSCVWVAGADGCRADGALRASLQDVDRAERCCVRERHVQVVDQVGHPAGWGVPRLGHLREEEIRNRLRVPAARLQRSGAASSGRA